MNRFSVPPLAARHPHTGRRRLRPPAAGAGHHGRAGALHLHGTHTRTTGNCGFTAAASRRSSRRASASARRGAAFYDARGGIIAPGLVDPHIHIESSMMTACAYAEGALLNGTTTIFCDSHEIGNVLDVAGIEMMLEDARQAPLSIFLTVPSTVPATTPQFETAGGDLTADKIGELFDRWPEAVALGEKMDFVQVTLGDERSHAILAAALSRGKPVCGHIYGQEFVAAYAASGITDTHEAVSMEIADDFLEAGIWVFLRGGPPTTPWHSLPQAIRTVTQLGANPKRVCVCTDDRDADDLFTFGLDWVVCQAIAAGLRPEQAWSLGSLHPATRYAMDGEIGGLGGGRRADLVLLDDDMDVHNTWYGGQLMVENREITPLLDQALSKRYRYPAAAYRTVHCAARRCASRRPRRRRRASPTSSAPNCPGSSCSTRGSNWKPPADGEDWAASLQAAGLCFVAVDRTARQERRGRPRAAQGFRPEARCGRQQRRATIRTI